MDITKFLLSTFSELASYIISQQNYNKMVNSITDSFINVNMSAQLNNFSLPTDLPLP